MLDIKLHDRKKYKKILVGGDGLTGKSSLLKSYIENIFDPNIRETIGVKFFSKYIEVNQQPKEIVFWELAGVERYRNLVPRFCEGADGALLIVDLTRPSTLENIPEWIALIRQNNPNIPVILIGLKIDLKNQIKIFEDAIRRYIDTHKLCDYILVSSKTGENLNTLFRTLYYYIFNNINCQYRRKSSQEIISQWAKQHLDQYESKLSKEFVRERAKKRQQQTKFAEKKINKIKGEIVDLGLKFKKLRIAEIAELCSIKERHLIRRALQEMINSGELKAHLFFSTDSVVFSSVDKNERTLLHNRIKTLKILLLIFIGLSLILLSVFLIYVIG